MDCGLAWAEAGTAAAGSSVLVVARGVADGGGGGAGSCSLGAGRGAVAVARGGDRPGTGEDAGRGPLAREAARGRGAGCLARDGGTDAGRDAGRREAAREVA